MTADGANGELRVAVDVTVPARTLTGVGVYAQDLLDGLGSCALDVRRWQQRLGAPRGGRTRLLNGCRLVRWHQVEVPRRIRREAIDVYHSACAVGPLHDACPVVMTVHDSSLARPAQYGRVDRLYYRVFARLAAHRAAALIVPSDASRRDVAAMYGAPPDRLHVVPYGVAPLFTPIEGPARAAVLHRYALCQPYVLFVGAEPPRKNLPRLVEAFARAMSGTRDNQTVLVLAGPPEPRDPRVDEAIVRSGLDGRVRRLGPVAREHLPALYSGATCLAYPSLYEGFGFPILEAMACGTSVLTSYGSSTEELAGGAAVLVDASDTTSITKGLTELLIDATLRQNLVARGRARVQAYTWARAARLTADVYRSVVANAR